MIVHLFCAEAALLVQHVFLSCSFLVFLFARGVKLKLFVSFGIQGFSESIVGGIAVNSPYN